MKLFLKSSGGFGNLQIQGTLDTDQLPEALAEKVRTVLTPEQLSAPHPRDTRAWADATQYEIDLMLDSGTQKFHIDDATAPPQVLDTVQELIQEIINRKRERS